jgi:hypothetical protein
MADDNLPGALIGHFALTPNRTTPFARFMK